MIVQIAFRNIWRNRLRSWVIITAIALGIFGGLAVISMAKGLTHMRQSAAIQTYVSHIQIHDSAYTRLGRMKDVVPNSDKLINAIEEMPEVRAVSSRLKIESFVQTARGTGGVILNGIDPENEKRLTNLHELCREGNYLEEFKRKPPIIISEKTAERLSADIKTTIRVSFTDLNGIPVTAGFKVVDVFQTSNSLYDEVNAFVRLEDLQALSSQPGVHEIALNCVDEGDVEKVQKELINAFPKLEIQTWRTIAPELGYADKMMDLVMNIFLSIIMLALAFGIVNTMLMAVLERKKELGMLLSVGMNKKKVFWMIMLESVFLAIIAAPIGIVFSVVMISIFQVVGIDLSFAADGLRSVGLGSKIYPQLDLFYYWWIGIMVVITALLACIYPARKALKLNPSETLRTSI